MPQPPPHPTPPRSSPHAAAVTVPSFQAVVHLLRKKEKMICSQLERNARSRAFDGAALWLLTA